VRTSARLRARNLQVFGEVKPAMPSVASHLELDEVVSPELVLVDPELAQIARRRLREPPEWRPQTPLHVKAPPISPPRPRIATAAPPATEQVAATRRHRRRATSVVAAAIPLSLLGAFVLAVLGSEVQARFQDPVASPEPAPVVSPQPRRASTNATARRPEKPATSRPTQTASGLNAATRPATTREIEVRTLALLADGSTGAPAALLDERLGRLANNVWIACRRVGQTARFTCRLGAGHSSSREWRLTASFAQDGSEVLTWDGRAR
jgi:hypothetical protein